MLYSELLERWLKIASSSEQKFDEYEFETLLMDVPDLQSIDHVFSVFEDGSKMAEKFKLCWRGLAASELKPSITTSELLIEAVRADLSEKCQALADFGLKQLAESTMTKPIMELSKLKPNDPSIQLAHHYPFTCDLDAFFVDKLKEDSSRSFALLRALTNFSGSMELAWAIGQELTSTQYKFEGFMNLWLIGARYLIQEDHVQVLQYSEDFGV